MSGKECRAQRFIDPLRNAVCTLPAGSLGQRVCFVSAAESGIMTKKLVSDQRA